MPGRYTLAVIIDEDDSIGETAAVDQHGTLAATGNGAHGLASIAKTAIDNQWDVTTLGGLDALRRAYHEIKDTHAAAAQAVKTLALYHKDAAYDFLVDNGYPLSWESLFPDQELPETAFKAAIMIQQWARNAERTGVITRRTVAGKASHWPLVAYSTGRPHFRTVNKAVETLKESPPDQSWMTGDTIDISLETLGIA